MTRRAGKNLGSSDLFCLGLNCVIGSGIFLAPGGIATHLGSAAPLAVLAAALLCFAISLCFAEMAAAVPGTGGAYLYAGKAFGPVSGFMVGWVMWLSGLVGWASVAAGFGELLGTTDGASPRTLSMLLVVLLTAVNMGGRAGALSNDLLAGFKMICLLLLAGWITGHSSGGWSPSLPEGGQPLMGFLLILYAFSGFEWMTVPAGEVEQAEKAIPRALLGVLLVAAMLYAVLLAGVVALGVAGEPAALAAAAARSGWLGPWVAVGGVLSVASVNAAIAFTCPRCLWTLAHEGWLPAWLGGSHADSGAPRPAVLVCGAATLLLVWWGDFATLASATVLISLLQYLAATLSLLWLRYRQPDLERPFRAPLLAPLLSLGCCLLLLATTPSELILKMGVLLLTGLIFSIRPAGFLPRNRGDNPG